MEFSGGLGGCLLHYYKTLSSKARSDKNYEKYLVHKRTVLDQGQNSSWLHRKQCMNANKQLDEIINCQYNSKVGHIYVYMNDHDWS